MPRRENRCTIRFDSLRLRWNAGTMTAKTYSVVFLFSSFIFAAQDASTPVPVEPVPVENEPLHHVVLKNESVVVIHLTLPPGDRTCYHTHTQYPDAIPLPTTSITHQAENDQ